MTKKARTRFCIALEDVGRAEDGPVTVRLRGLLKRALRTWRFRCTSVVELAGQPECSGRPEPSAGTGRIAPTAPASGGTAPHE